jgi:hypothetical protein
VLPLQQEFQDSHLPEPALFQRPFSQRDHGKEKRFLGFYANMTRNLAREGLKTEKNGSSFAVPVSKPFKTFLQSMLEF